MFDLKLGNIHGVIRATHDHRLHGRLRLSKRAMKPLQFSNGTVGFFQEPVQSKDLESNRRQRESHRPPVRLLRALDSGHELCGRLFELGAAWWLPLFLGHDMLRAVNPPSLFTSRFQGLKAETP
ncbi:MAG: hypothetical protein ACOX9C_12085 [Kiritimatiellia bacterium]|jgi:hypothetical protein